MSKFAHKPNRGASDVWLTPPHVVKATGPFDLDPCAAPSPRPWATAAKHYDITQGQNGLTLPWAGMVWCNPPFGPEAGKWLQLVADHGSGIALVLARTETEWFFKTAWERAGALFFLRGRLNFHYPNGERADQNCGAPPVLIGYGDEACRRLAHAPRAGLSGHLTFSAAMVLTKSDGSPVGTWSEALDMAMSGRTLHIRDIYRAAEGTAKVREAKAVGHNWRAQLRRALQRDFHALGNATWKPA